MTEYQHKWYMKNRDRILKERKVYRENNKEKVILCKKVSMSKKPEYYKDLAKKEYIKRKGSERYIEISRRADKKYKERHPDMVKLRTKKWKEKNPEHVKETRRIYIRQHSLTINGKTLTGLDKRPYHHTCEVCGKKVTRAYHHWDDNNPNKGIWLCNGCHFMAERVDKELHTVYLNIKNDINLDKNIKQFDHPELVMKLKTSETAIV